MKSGGDVKNMTSKNERIRFTLRLPNELMDKLKQAAQEQELSINSLILHILWNWSERG